MDKMAVTGEFVAHTLATLAGEAGAGSEPDAARAPRGLISRSGCGVVLLGLRAVIRPGPVPQRHLPGGQRRLLHGLPHDYALRDGDVLTAPTSRSRIDGWAADSARDGHHRRQQPTPLTER